MMLEIRSKWVVNYKNWYVIVTENKDVYDVKTMSKLIPTYDNGRIAHRIIGTTKRIGQLTINKHCKLENKIYQQYIPF